jgi:hypothetical protein
VTFLLTDGLEMVAPWTHLSTEDYPMIKIDNATAMQLDFTEGISSEIFSGWDCDVTGEAGYNIGAVEELLMI